MTTIQIERSEIERVRRKLNEMILIFRRRADTPTSQLILDEAQEALHILDNLLNQTTKGEAG